MPARLPSIGQNITQKGRRPQPSAGITGTRYDNLSDKELEQIRRFIEETDIDVIDDETRELVEKHWPWLVAKLPPRTVQ
jgi:hypothetical protein